MSTTINAVKTVTATEAELFAGASALEGRTFLSARNEDDIMSCTIGGQTVEAGEIVKFNMSGSSSDESEIYAVSNGRSLKVSVYEYAG